MKKSLVNYGIEKNEQGIVHQLLLKKDIIKTAESVMNTISIQNIVKEMERKELDSWQKLIRVLTHEIMNSVSPVISLTKSITKQYTNIPTNMYTTTEIPTAQETDAIIRRKDDRLSSRYTGRI